MRDEPPLTLTAIADHIRRSWSRMSVSLGGVPSWQGTELSSLIPIASPSNSRAGFDGLLRSQDISVVGTELLARGNAVSTEIVKNFVTPYRVFVTTLNRVGLASSSSTP